MPSTVAVNQTRIVESVGTGVREPVTLVSHLLLQCLNPGAQGPLQTGRSDHRAFSHSTEMLPGSRHGQSRA